MAIAVAVVTVIFSYGGQPAAALNRLLHVHEFALWLNRAPIHFWARGITRGMIYTLPIIQWIHILAVSAIAGTVGLMSLRMMGLLPFTSPLADMARRLLPWTWVAIAVNVVTGIFMVVDRPRRSLDALSFPYKMLFLIAATALTVAFAVTLSRDPDYWERSPARRATVRALGAVSIFLWIGVIVGGRWIFYAKAPI